MTKAKAPSKIQLQVLHRLLGPGQKVRVSFPSGSGANAYIRFLSATAGGGATKFPRLTTSTIESLRTRGWIKMKERVAMTSLSFSADHTYVITNEGRNVAMANPVTFVSTPEVYRYMYYRGRLHAVQVMKVTENWIHLSGNDSCMGYRSRIERQGAPLYETPREAMEAAEKLLDGKYFEAVRAVNDLTSQLSSVRVVRYMPEDSFQQWVTKQLDPEKENV